MLVSISDIKKYMDISLTARQEDAAEMILAGLQSELESYLRRPIEVQEFTEEHRLNASHTGIPMGTFLTANDNSYNYSFDSSPRNDMTTWASPPPAVYFKNTPIVSITEVKVKPIFGTEKTLEEETDYVTRPYGIDYYYGYADDLITVTYEAGLDGASIPVLKLLILRAASREMQNMHDDVVSVKDLNTRNVGPLVTGFLDTELASVRKYRRVRA